MIISSAKAMEAAEVLGVALVGLTADVLSKAYRSKARECHPDTCDNPELWARVGWAKEVLVRWLESRPTENVTQQEGDCRACGGNGRINVTRGFGRPTSVMCVMCNGSGRLKS